MRGKLQRIHSGHQALNMSAVGLHGNPVVQPRTGMRQSATSSQIKKSPLGGTAQKAVAAFGGLRRLLRTTSNPVQKASCPAASFGAADENNISTCCSPGLFRYKSTYWRMLGSAQRCRAAKTVKEKNK
jgi:hypothetical protein